MIFINNPGIIFKRKDQMFSFNVKFNIILFSNDSILYDDTIESLGYVVPIDYRKFIATESRDFDLFTNLNDIFEFTSNNDLKLMQQYVRHLQTINTKK